MATQAGQREAENSTIVGTPPTGTLNDSAAGPIEAPGTGNTHRYNNTPASRA
jgi:hypothetical protein